MNPANQKQALRQHQDKIHGRAVRLGNHETTTTEDGRTLSQHTSAQKIVEAAQ